MNPQAADPVGLRLSIPASTSNLGPGFDFLGLALALFLDLRVIGRAEDGRTRFVELEGTAADWPQGEANLVQLAFDHVLRAAGVSDPGLLLAARSEIPLARGLGSSGAAVVAGILLARHAAGVEAGMDRMLAWGLEIEGHPDNSSAALLGGCTLSVPVGGGKLRVVRAELSPELGFVLAWSERRLSTREARAVLPASVPFRDAIENPRRLALLLEGLRRADGELIALGIEDKLHTPYRLPLIAGGAEALAAARAAGAWAATISGSGSALIAIGPRPRRTEIAAGMASALHTAAGGPVHARAIEPAHGAPRVDHSRG